HAALDQVDVDSHEATQLDATAEGNLAVALGEVQVSDREDCPVNEYRVESPGALRQVLNVLVPTIHPRGSSSCCLCTDTSTLDLRQVAEYSFFGLGRERERWHSIWVRSDQVAFTLIPFG